MQLNEEINLQSCDTFQMNANEDFDTVDTEEVPELSRKKSSGDQHSISKKWRIEDLLKNLVGKKPSPLLTVHKKKTSSDQDLTEEEALVHQSNVKISISDIHKFNSTAKNQMTFKSTASLNTMSTSGVKHNLWSVMPLLSRKEDSSLKRKGKSCFRLKFNLKNSTISNSYFSDEKSVKIDTQLTRAYATTE